MFNKTLFMDAVTNAGMTVGKVAVKLGIDQSTLYRKIRGRTEFTRSEIHALRAVLNLDARQTEIIFFA